MTNKKNWIELCALEEIPKRGSRRLKLGEIDIAIFRTGDDEIYAIEDKCPHLGGRLSEGIVHDSCVTCPLHNLVIDLRDGKAQSVEPQSVRCFPVKLENQNIYLSMMDEMIEVA